VKPSTALSETKGFVTAALHLAHHEDPEREQKDERNRVDQDRNPVPAVILFYLAGDALLKKELRKIVESRRNGGRK